jgi:hypothetical protein
VGASERDEFLRAAWRVMVAGEIHAERLVFVDECSTNISLAPLYAWSLKGERAVASVPRNWGKNVTLLASISLRGMGPCLAVEGSTTREVFETYLERLLAPSLRSGQVVVMDKSSPLTRVRESESSSKAEVASCSTYRPTRPISIPSKKHLPRQRRWCAKPKLVAARH